jgi:hypothetical protein
MPDSLRELSERNSLRFKPGECPNWPVETGKVRTEPETVTIAMDELTGLETKAVKKGVFPSGRPRRRAVAPSTTQPDELSDTAILESLVASSSEDSIRQPRMTGPLLTEHSQVVEAGGVLPAARLACGTRVSGARPSLRANVANGFCPPRRKWPMSF